ncbi:MAG: Tetratricopeptide (TPR) repeat [Verrucomicrobia bacterium]|nr:MAG: Tetratricopeptide (TPR) repeat [Verrucomicrobiota bacterium]
MNLLFSQGLRGGFLAGCAALAVGGCSRAPSTLPIEMAPVLAHVVQLGAKKIYFNGAAFSELVKTPPVWLGAEDRVSSSEHVRAMAQAVMDPKLFRQLDRQERFEVLLLVGDPMQFRPLMEHLLKTQDWALDRVDPWSLVYRRGGAETFTMESIWNEAGRWDKAPNPVRAAAVAAISERLVAAGRLEAAGELLEVAKKLDASGAPVCAAEGWYRLARGEWKQAVAAADRALRSEKRFRPALSVKAQGLYFSRRFAEAYELSRELLEEAPKDPVMLFMHAKISHEVRAFQEEVLILRQLIELATREKRSTSWYDLYMGQALATTGKGEAALQSFDKALADPELPADQRDFAKSARAKVQLHLRPPGDGWTKIPAE